MVSKFQKLAHEIIDMVEARLRELFPDIEIMASEMEGNTLLEGGNYYDLENEVAQEIESSLRD